MAVAGIHFSGNEQPTARVTRAGEYSYIVVEISEGSVLYLPMSDDGPRIARALAAVLIKAADEQDAILHNNLAVGQEV